MESVSLRYRVNGWVATSSTTERRNGAYGSKSIGRARPPRPSFGSGLVLVTQTMPKKGANSSPRRSVRQVRCAYNRSDLGRVGSATSPNRTRVVAKLCESFNLRKAVEPTQRRKGAETQGFRLLGAITQWVSYVNLFFPGHLPVPCAFASWRLCVNCRF